MTTDEIMALADDFAQAFEAAPINDFEETVRTRSALRKAVEALAADAAKWKAYKARKEAAIAAGFGHSPLRKETP